MAVLSFTLRSAWTPQLAQPFSCGKLTAYALSPTDAAPTRTAVAPGAVCGPSRYRGCGTFGRSRLFQVSGAPPSPGLCPVSLSQPRCRHLHRRSWSPGGLSRKQVCLGWLCVKCFCSQSLQKAHPRFLRLVPGKEELFFGKLDCTAASSFSSSSTNV